VPVKAHWSIGKMERYYIPLQYAFEILYFKLRAIISEKAIFQIAIKAVNDTAGPNGLIPTLLIFGAYLYITAELPLLPLLV